MDEDGSEGPGEGLEFALPGDMIRQRHIATRASNRRRILVITVDGTEFEGYSIGLDSHSLQLLEVPSGEVSSIALAHIVSISDDKLYENLSPIDKNMVDRRTASFRRVSQLWLVGNWPAVYESRSVSRVVDRSPRVSRQIISSKLARAEGQARQEYEDRESRLNGDGDTQVRD